jgi:hypothetical protein
MMCGDKLRQPEQVLGRLIGELDRWGVLFLEVARSRDIPVVEQVLGGLAEWMGNDLIDGWLHLPIPVFDELSDRSEELFQACRGYLEQLRQRQAPLPAQERRSREGAIGAVLDRIRTLADLPGGHRAADELER